MHCNINITGYQYSTLCIAEIDTFWNFQTVDSQYVFLFKSSIHFTGKELDSETGYSYFGARYYDAELSGLFFSVDPMADKYPNISSYAYCAWNPLKLVDPTGALIDDYFSFNGKYLGKDNAKTNNVRIISESVWNSLEKKGDGTISHEEGMKNSSLFSQASSEMTQEAQLEVYNHYNPTNCNLVVDKPKIENKIGMHTTTIKRKTHIGIYLDNNRKGIKMCDYADEIINSFSHEERHVLDHKARKYKFDYEYERSAIKAQISHESFNKTRPIFRHS